MLRSSLGISGTAWAETCSNIHAEVVTYNKDYVVLVRKTVPSLTADTTGCLLSKSIEVLPKDYMDGRQE
jgi:hypothetical protein